MSTIAAIIGRLLLALIFVLAGLNKILSVGETSEYIHTATGLPGSLALPVGIFELVAGLLMAIGLMTRLTSILLFGFTLLTIFFFHNQFGDPMQMQMALKNLAIAGGLLLVFAYGQMRGSYDHIRATRKGEVATQDADTRAHEAELRAARAEGLAEGRAETSSVIADRNDNGRPG